MPQAPPLRPVDLGPLDIVVAPGADGAIHARSPFALGPYDAKVTAWLDLWAARTPQRIFLAERDAGNNWRGLTYAEARAQVRALAQALIERNLGPERPLIILSGNSIAHALLGLAALYAGIPYAPISPAYSLASRDFARLKRIIALLTPGLVYAEDGALYSAAIAAAVPESVEILTCGSEPLGRSASDLGELLSTRETPALEAAQRAVGPETIAKFMFTSGSVAEPKAVITTQRMLCANQAMIAHVLRFLQDEPPVLVDWLPWHHSFGGNQNFGLVLRHGGTLYIDAGRPTPDGIEATLANLREIAPTLYFNVPQGFEVLLPHLARDKALAKNFFSRLTLNFFAGASLPRHCRESLAEIAAETCGERILMMSGYGATETSPAALFSTPLRASGALPLPGSELKLVPHGEKREARIKGPHVTSGYWRNEALTQRAFDRDGYYRLGDALAFADEDQPRQGLCFAGRIDEDFKLATAAWVSVGPLRENLIAAFTPFVKDAAIAGPGEAYLAALVFADLDACRALAGLGARVQPDAILRHPAVLAKFAALLAAFAGSAQGTSTRIVRLALVGGAPSADAGELTEKGSLNQSAVLANRAALVADLYAGRSTAAPIVALAANLLAPSAAC
jgi:feruloyl-CoA synthase